MRHIARRAAACLSVAVLAACGGGGGGGDANPPPVSRAEGAYSGSLTGSPGLDTFTMVVLENDEFWSIYGDTVGSTLYVYGFMHGQGASSNGSFSGSGAHDYSYTGAVSTANVAATYNPGVSASGTLTYTTGIVSFSGTSAALAPYDYNATPSLAEVAGNWNMSALNGDYVQATVQANGSFTTVSGGCTSTGTATPRPSGKNVFDVTLTTGPAPCVSPNTTGTGIAIYAPIVGTTQHQLIVATVANGNPLLGSLAVGAR